MAVYSGPEIVNDGLVFAYDMANTQKSWKGAPTTNLLLNSLPSGITTGYGVSGGTGSVTYDSTNQAIKWVRDTYATWGSYLIVNPIFNGNLDIAAQYTISFEWKTENTAVSNSVYAYSLVQGNGQSPAASANLLSNSVLQSNGWYLFRYTFFPANTGVDAYNRVILGTQGTNVSTFYWRKIQFEKTGFASPFVDGTRSNTQAILDLTGNNTITVDSLTYNSAGAFSFNGTDNRISISNGIVFGNGFSFEAVVFPLSAGENTYGRILDKTTSTGSAGGVFLYMNASTVVSLVVNNGATITTPLGSVPYNKWSIICATVNSSGSAVIYINGRQVTIGTTNAPSGITVTNPLTIGNRSTADDRSFNGDIHAVKVYNRALSAAEVKQNFEATRGRYGI